MKPSKLKVKAKSGLVFSRPSRTKTKQAEALRKQLGLGRNCAISNQHSAWKAIYERGVIRARAMGFSSPEAEAFVAADVETTRVYADKQWHSIYVNSSAVVDFIENAAPRQSDGKLIAQAAADLEGQATENGLSRGVMIHLANRPQSILVTAKKDESATAFLYSVGDEVGHAAIFNDGTWSELEGKALAAVFNLFMYMSAFPDAVKDGPPELIKGRIDGVVQQEVVASPAIEETFERSKAAPHMRRGHFRVLQSEKFTNKRFQAVYVKPAMVRGTAETVGNQSGH